MNHKSGSVQVEIWCEFCRFLVTNVGRHGRSCKTYFEDQETLGINSSQTFQPSLRSGEARTMGATIEMSQFSPRTNGAKLGAD